jgi:hypothetical protein
VRKRGNENQSEIKKNPKMKNFDNFIYNKSTLPQDENEKKLFFKKPEEQFYNELMVIRISKIL